MRGRRVVRGRIGGAAGVVGIALAIGACGGDDDGAAAPRTAALPGRYERHVSAADLTRSGAASARCGLRQQPGPCGPFIEVGRWEMTIRGRHMDFGSPSDTTAGVAAATRATFTRRGSLLVVRQSPASPRTRCRDGQVGRYRVTVTAAAVRLRKLTDRCRDRVAYTQGLWRREG